MRHNVSPNPTACRKHQGLFYCTEKLEFYTLAQSGGVGVRTSCKWKPFGKGTNTFNSLGRGVLDVLEFSGARNRIHVRFYWEQPHGSIGTNTRTSVQKTEKEMFTKGPGLGMKRDAFG